MPTVYDAIDLHYLWNGDYDIGGNGDIADTSDDGLQSLIDQIHDICASSFRDWELYPNRGAGLEDFIGEPSSRETASRIHDRLRIAMTSAGLVFNDDLQVRIMPVHANKILIVVVIDAVATENNSLADGQQLTIAFVYDTIERETFFLEKPPLLTAA